MSSYQNLIALFLAVGLAATAVPAGAQKQGCGNTPSDSEPSHPSFASRRDSLDWVRNKKAADNSKGFRILVGQVDLVAARHRERQLGFERPFDVQVQLRFRERGDEVVHRHQCTKGQGLRA